MPVIYYNRNDAVKYAHKWALSRNPRYATFDKLGGDSTNFASQCLYAGSDIMNFTPDLGWFYLSFTQRSAPWSGAAYLYQFLLQNHGPGPYGENLPLFQAAPGDIIQLSFDGEKYTQTLVVVKAGDKPSPDNVRVATHNEDADDKLLSDYKYISFRLVHIMGVRK
ncbi:MAG: amidase domain-containing protein [Oscillospiraceae bacterium]|jgi:hypothetical protein|nr:amidase domain-containing protein [Oscillospiraceae bacterium]